MNRRRAIAGLAGSVAFSAGGVAYAEQPKATIPGAVELKMDKEIEIGVRTASIKVDKTDLHLISIGNGTFRLDRESRLTAKLKAAVLQYAKVEYWISAAVFDTAGKLLGTAGHKEVMEHIRLGKMFTILREIALDFGISYAFKDAAFVVVAISDRGIPKPD